VKVTMHRTSDGGGYFTRRRSPKSARWDVWARSAEGQVGFVVGSGNSEAAERDATALAQRYNERLEGGTEAGGTGEEPSTWDDEADSGGQASVSDVGGGA
jgi:hypothetical protein